MGTTKTKLSFSKIMGGDRSSLYLLETVALLTKTLELFLCATVNSIDGLCSMMDDTIPSNSDLSQELA